MKEKKYTYSNLELLQECPNCGMLLNIAKKKCTDCNTSLVFEVPKEFKNENIEDLFAKIRFHFQYFEKFINKEVDKLYHFNYNGAYTKIIEETIKNPTEENKDKLFSITEYCERTNRVLYEIGLDWEFFEKNEDFNKTVSDINKIANRENCLRPILYPNDEDLDDTEYYEWKNEYNSFKSFETIKEEFAQPEESYDFEIVEKESKFKTELEKYDFFLLSKVSVLNEKQKNELIAIIHNKKIGYIIAWFEYLGFLKYFGNSFSKNNSDRNRKLAIILKSNDREIGGHINSFNVHSKDRKRYKSFTFLEQIQQEYETLKN